jgi:peroxiredoxin family protein
MAQVLQDVALGNVETSVEAVAEAVKEPGQKSLAIICWSNDLDKVWPVLILASTGAAQGMKVDVFFTFWGLRVLQKNNNRVTGKSWMQVGESLVDKGGTDNLKLGKINFGGMGTWMIKRLAKKHGVASPTELLEAARDLGVNLMPCQMTMDLYGLSNEDFIDGLPQACGAASFLDIAADADITLFI